MNTRWRNHTDHRSETKTVRQALQALGINAKITHGKGTAWGWLEINIGKLDEWPHNHAPQSYCPDNCPHWLIASSLRHIVLDTVKRTTGRHGDYNGEINILTQDHWNRKEKRTEPIPQDKERIEKLIAERA